MKKRSLVDGHWSIAGRRGELPGTRRRLGRFSLVGALGIAVQLGVLALLRRAGMDYLIATVLAVEAAILHNFVWHERYTWRDRGVVSGWESLARLVRFHLTNGAVSLAGNAVAMRWLVGELHLPVIAANLIAITTCWLLNFVLSDRVVFTRCES
ncbi:MAG: GtrA family protein [Acidobacteriia bacterium]|nr:GtrA family protein [Terriglobia bacterium]